MTMEDLIRLLPVLGIILFQEFGQAFAKYCGGDVYCYSPQKCCGTSIQCCYDRNADNFYHQNYKLHVWNMWYFWFIIIFILMSCFGGCGYYRRRRMATLSQHQQNGVPPVTRRPQSRNNHGSIPTSYYAYSGPGAVEPSEISFLPPPYAEVVSQPDLYPANKIELPPYPGAPVITADSTTTSPPLTLNAQQLSATTAPQPPPYTEIVNSMQPSNTTTSETSPQAAPNNHNNAN